MLMPEPLAPGSHIRIVSPGLPTLALVPERATRADRALRDLGYDISYGTHAFSVSADGITAGTTEERAADLMAAFADTSVDAILTSDSGLGSRDLLPLLDATVIAANAKPFIGWCDTVFLHQYLASCVGMTSYYGCVFTVHLGEAGGPFPETVDYFQQALTGSGPLRCRPMATRIGKPVDFFVPELESRPRSRDLSGGWTWLRPGQARGPLVGGELSILPDLVECFGLRLEGRVLFWDVGGHNTQPIRPQFQALCTRCETAGLRDLAGMIVGAHTGIQPAQWAMTVADLLRDLLPGTTFPVLANADISHAYPAWTVPYGGDVVLSDHDGMTFPREKSSRSADEPGR